MPVEVILRQVQHSSRIGLQAEGAVQLKTRQFQHPYLRQAALFQRLAQHIQCRRADIASHFHGEACTGAQ